MASVSAAAAAADDDDDGDEAEVTWSDYVIALPMRSRNGKARNLITTTADRLRWCCGDA